MFSFIVAVVIVGGSIAVIAVMTVGADNKGATSERETRATPVVSEPEVPAFEPEVPAFEPEVPAAAVSAHSSRPNAGIAALLEVTGGAPLERRRFRGLSRLIGAIAGTGFVMGLSIAVVTVALMLVLRVLVDV
ncbi:MAG: hypothetical protein WA797_00230 [Acidimicrobiales bacterium]